MLEEYKENILKYVTGNLEQQAEVNIPEFEDITSRQNNLKTSLSQYFTGMVTYTAFIPSKDIQNQNIGYSVLACIGTLIGREDTSGAFVILDEDYDIVQFIPTYSNGSLIGEIKCINVDNQGRFYAVEYSNNSYKIVELNNIVLKRNNQANFEVVETKRIEILNQYVWTNMFRIQRDDSGNRYFILASRSEGMVGISLEVTDQLAWTFFTTTYNWSGVINALFNQGLFVYWDNNNNLHFKIAVDSYGLIILQEQNSNVMAETRFTTNDVASSYNNFVFYSNQIGYYADIEDKTTYTQYRLYEVDITTKVVKLLYEAQGNYDARNQMWLFKNNNDIYFYKIENSGTQDEYNLSFGLIYNSNIYMEEIGTYTGDIWTKVVCYANIVNKFNRNYLYIQNQNEVFTLNFIWNDNNYNGTPYISNKSLIPNSIIIEDENENEIFNRNLYNLSVYANMYTAIGQIPNYSLNNDTLYNALLISKGNNIMCSKNIDTTKNVYEELNINFNTKINIYDNDYNLSNINGSSRLVNSMINNDTQAFIGKYRINYKDETSVIKNISYKNLTYTNNKTNYNIVVYTDKLINTIELLSNDEQTSYKTINCNSMTLNKYYQINNSLRIE